MIRKVTARKIIQDNFNPAHSSLMMPMTLNKMIPLNKIFNTNKKISCIIINKRISNITHTQINKHKTLTCDETHQIDAS